MADDEFQTYDLKIEVVHGDKNRPLVCQHKLGDTFFLRGSRIELPPGGSFGMWAMAAVLPFLPAKQRPTATGDWMSTDANIACTDPHCGAHFRITRLELRSYKHADFTKVPLGTPA
jgi:uncharacterized repeat protein (TIGR04076 family)